MKASVACPSCGGALEFDTSISLLAVCPYCRSLVIRRDLRVEDLGRVAQLQPDGTPLQLGASGRFEDASFSAAGRVQMRYPDGFWNEWFLVFADGRRGWLGEAQGAYAVSFPVETPGPLPAYDGLRVDETRELAGATYTLVDKRRAQYVAAEGQLPFRPPFGEWAPLADFSAEGGRFATLDYSEPAPLLFTGRYVEFEALALQGLREVPGW